VNERTERNLTTTNACPYEPDFTEGLWDGLTSDTDTDTGPMVLSSRRAYLASNGAHWFSFTERNYCKRARWTTARKSKATK
jgi:hypothetical protein